MSFEKGMFVCEQPKRSGGYEKTYFRAIPSLSVTPPDPDPSKSSHWHYPDSSVPIPLSSRFLSVQTAPNLKRIRANANVHIRANVHVHLTNIVSIIASISIMIHRCNTYL